MQTAIAISKLAAEIATHYWGVSVALTAFAIGGLVAGNPLRTQSFRRVACVIGFAYAIPVLIVVVGPALHYDHASQPIYRAPPNLYGIALWMPIVLYLLVFLGCVVVARGWRLRTAALLAPGLWFSACAIVPAGFAIAGVGP